ncbi:TrmH family RNA methyltransferase [Rhizobium sp. C1]|uniref:TrmH family RNA methyltransferase n=1 Tax=Rhizobium sp. C1 TaxID=1349799 RepID=UPI001E53A387|nr:RNA methyltransferase [Rhizobium sp. C1]MCD2180145.1 RNA methyltransferase [Rhizobium sp. C1]
MSDQRPLPIRIEDAEDPAVAEFRDIRERDLVGRTGRFIAEGTVVLNMLATAHGQHRGFRAEKILVLENRLAGIEETLGRFPADVPVYMASAAVIDAIAGFNLHRGVLALGRKPAPRPLEAELADLPARALVTVLSGISNHDNAGAIFRNSAAFGASLVILDETSCDPLYRKAIRVSVGSVLTVPFHRGGRIDDILTKLDEAGFTVWGLSPAGKTPLRDLPASPRTALLLGTEGEGLPQDLMRRINTARIAQMPRLDSLNVATAAALSLHEMAHRMRILED